MEMRLNNINCGIFVCIVLCEHSKTTLFQICWYEDFIVAKGIAQRFSYWQNPLARYAYIKLKQTTDEC